MGMMINRRRVMLSKSDALPYDRIEYLQSNGVDSQYIQLPIKVQEGLDIHCKFSIVEASNYGYIFGSQESGDYLIVRQYGTSGKIQTILFTGGATESLSHIGDIRDVHIHFWNESQTCLLDDTTLLNKATPYNRVTTYSIRLWYPKSGNNLFTGKVRIYSFSIYLHDQLVLDFVPVKDNGIGYMYDKVSGQLFGNSGTGDFILGPDK